MNKEYIEWLEVLLYEAREDLKESDTNSFIQCHATYKALLSAYNKAKEYYNG